MTDGFHTIHLTKKKKLSLSTVNNVKRNKTHSDNQDCENLHVIAETDITKYKIKVEVFSI